MTPQPQHYNPVGNLDTLDTWRKRIRMPVPAKACHILDVRIVALYETTSVNGLPLDALIEARITEEKPMVQFGVIFSQSPLDWDKYGIPILWIDDKRTNIGRWKGMVRAEYDDRFCWRKRSVVASVCEWPFTHLFCRSVLDLKRRL